MLAETVLLDQVRLELLALFQRAQRVNIAARDETAAGLLEQHGTGEQPCIFGWIADGCMADKQLVWLPLSAEQTGHAALCDTQPKLAQLTQVHRLLQLQAVLDAQLFL